MDAKKQVAQVVLLKVKRGVWNEKDTYQVQVLAEKARKAFQNDVDSSEIAFSAYFTAASHIINKKVFCDTEETSTALLLYGLAFRFLLLTVQAAAALAKAGSVLNELGEKATSDETALVKFVTTLLLGALTQKELRDRQSAAPYQALLLLERIQAWLYTGEEEPGSVRTVGQIARNVAIVLHEQGHSQLAARAMQMACRLYLLWSQAGDFDSRVAECDLPKNFLLLASYQLSKNREVESGLQSLVWVVVLSPADNLLPQPSDAVVGRLKQWCVQKRTALEGGVKEAGDVFLATQLRSCLGLCPQRDTPELQHALLSCYVGILVRHSYGSLAERVAATDSLLNTIAVSDVEARCNVLIQKLTAMHSSPEADTQDYLAVCDKGLSFLARSGKPSWMSGVFKTIRCVFMFEAMSSSDDSGTPAQSDLSSDILTCTRAAITSWQEILCEKKLASIHTRSVQLPQVFKAMSWVVCFLRLLGQPLDEVVACRLLALLIKSTDLVKVHGAFYLSAAVEVIASSCVSLAAQGAAQYAECLLRIAEALGSRAQLSADVSNQIALHLDLARAAIAAQYGQVEECVASLSSAADKSVRSSANGQLFMIAAQVSRLDPGVWTGGGLSEDRSDATATAPQLALWSFHSCRSRLKHVGALSSQTGLNGLAPAGTAAGQDSSGADEHQQASNSSSKALPSSADQPCNCLYNAVFQYLDCCRQGARIYLYAGCAAEALSFISQGLALAKQHQLLNWENHFRLLQVECDVHSASASQVEETIANSHCDCVERQLSSLSVQSDDNERTPISAAAPPSCCEKEHSDRYILEKANCVCNETMLAKAAHAVRQGEYDSGLDSQLWKGSFWEGRRRALLARHQLSCGQAAAATEQCQKGLENFGVWPPTADAGRSAHLSVTQRGCVAELLYLFAMCLCATPAGQQYISESWLQPRGAAQSVESASSPEEATPVAKRQSKRPSSSAKARKPAAASSTGKRRGAKSAVSMAMSATASAASPPAASRSAAASNDASLGRACLERAYHMACQVACVPLWVLRDICLALGTLVGWRNLRASVNYFQTAHAISLQYQLHHHLSMQSKSTDGASLSVQDIVGCLKQQQQQGRVPTSLVDHALATLPSTWTLCSLNKVQLPGTAQSYLILAQIRAGHLALVRLPLMSDALPDKDAEDGTPKVVVEPGSNIIDDLQSIMGKAGESLAIKSKQKFWAKRKALDSQLSDLLEYLEARLLGAWHVLMSGQPVEQDRDSQLWQAAVASSVEAVGKYMTVSSGMPSADQTHLAEMLLEVCLSSWDDRTAFAASLAKLLGLDDASPILKKLVTCLRQACMGLEQPSDEPAPTHPVILLSDKALQQLPWESMVCIQEQAISRMPSLALLLTHLSYRQRSDLPLGRFLMDGIDADDTFYVLNPEKNLPDTQKMFEGYFHEHANWQGVVGCAPSPDQFSRGLSEKELFIYCGHGNGSMFLGRKKVEKLQCRAVTLLMGCSSGKLWVDGDMDEQGTVLSYLVAGCPAVVAMLWDVTDRDLDRFTDSLLRNWIGSRRQLLEFVNGAREECRLPHLTGAAPVVYGLPVKCG